MECLLAFIEFSQFERYLLSQIDIKERNESDIDVKLINFPSNIPMSIIVEETIEKTKDVDDGKMYDIKMRAYRLYKKYIEMGSEFEINIGAVFKNEMEDLFDDIDILNANDNINIIDLISKFDRMKEEMFQLLTISVSRFRFKTEFDEIVHIFKVNNHSKYHHDDNDLNMKKEDMSPTSTIFMSQKLVNIPSATKEGDIIIVATE